MSELVKRNWAAIFGALLFLVAASTAIWLGTHSARTVIAQQEPSPSETPITEESVASSRIYELREALALEDRDLAAMDCTPEQAEQVLRALGDWYTDNAPTLQNIRLQEREAKARVREAMQKIHIGQRDATLRAQLPELKQDFAKATQARRELIGSAVLVISSKLSSQQQEIWSAARSNVQLPWRYRYIPSLNATQAEQLMSTISRYGYGSKQLASVESSELYGYQVLAMETASMNTQARVEQVVQTTQQLLPVPSDQQ